MRTKLHKTYNLLIKAAIVLVAYYVIYKQVFVHHTWDEIIQYFGENYAFSRLVFPLILIIILMIANWGIESIKWQYLIRKSETINLKTSVQGVFSGITISSLTPNRIGEYFGRVFILKKTHPVRGILMTIVGSLSQLLVTVIMGGLALLYVILRFPELIYPETPVLYGVSIVLLILFMIVVTGIYLNLKGVSGILHRLTKKWPKINRFIHVFSYYNRKELLNVFLFSLSRYLVFSSQLYILMLIFHIQLSVFEGLIIVSLIFLAITIIPSVALAEIGIRGSVAIYVIQQYFLLNELNPGSGFELNVMASTTVLWLINIILPGIIGSLFIFKLSFFNSKDNGN
ncbi:MAG: lysylphosphatidylglycerol synthase domain-containing protein [Bacteroidota bacterium]